jgi:hypothetical protein
LEKEKKKFAMHCEYKLIANSIDFWQTQIQNCGMQIMIYIVFVDNLIKNSVNSEKLTLLKPNAEICFNIGHKLHNEKHNYSAGPCILPQEVFEKSAQAILNFNAWIIYFRNIA